MGHSTCIVTSSKLAADAQEWLWLRFGNAIIVAVTFSEMKSKAKDISKCWTKNKDQNLKLLHKFVE